MVDCFAAMVKIEAEHLANKKVLIIGTEFTASQHLYPDILSAASPGVRISTIAATKLERKIARFQPWNSGENSALTGDLEDAIKLIGNDPHSQALKLDLAAEEDLSGLRICGGIGRAQDRSRQDDEH